MPRLDAMQPIKAPYISQLECYFESDSRQVVTEVSSPVDDVLQPFNDPRVAVMIEPRLRPSIDIMSNYNDSGSDEPSELASSSSL